MVYIKSVRRSEQWTARNTTVQYCQPPTFNLLHRRWAPLHTTQRYRQTDRQTDRRQYHAKSQSYCMQQYDWLKFQKKHWSIGKDGQRSKLQCKNVKSHRYLLEYKKLKRCPRKHFLWWWFYIGAWSTSDHRGHLSSDSVAAPDRKAGKILRDGKCPYRHVYEKGRLLVI